MACLHSWKHCFRKRRKVNQVAHSFDIVALPPGCSRFIRCKFCPLTMSTSSLKSSSTWNVSRWCFIKKHFKSIKIRVEEGVCKLVILANQPAYQKGISSSVEKKNSSCKIKEKRASMWNRVKEIPAVSVGHYNSFIDLWISSQSTKWNTK